MKRFDSFWKPFFLFRISRGLRNRIHWVWMVVALIILLVLPVALASGLLVKSWPLLSQFSLNELLLSEKWMPGHNQFGFYSFIISSVLVTFLAVIIAASFCIFASLLLTQFAPKRLVSVVHPVIDILSGIPSVIYGLWGVLFVVPFVSEVLAPYFGETSSGYCILSGALVLAVMIIPFVLNILIDVFTAIPVELTEASLSLGAGMFQTVKKVIVRKALPGIISAFGLGVSRAFGETMAVLMVVGNVSAVPGSLFDAGYPLPALIANNYGEMMSIPGYESALMLGALILFIVVLTFNMLSRLTILRFERRL